MYTGGKLGSDVARGTASERPEEEKEGIKKRVRKKPLSTPGRGGGASANSRETRKSW